VLVLSVSSAAWLSIKLCLSLFLALIIAFQDNHKVSCHMRANAIAITTWQLLWIGHAMQFAINPASMRCCLLPWYLLLALC